MKKKIAIFTALICMANLMTSCTKNTEIEETASNTISINISNTETSLNDETAINLPNKSYTPYEYTIYNKLGTGIKRPDDFEIYEVYYTSFFGAIDNICIVKDESINSTIWKWVTNTKQELEDSNNDLFALYSKTITNNEDDSYTDVCYQLKNGYLFAVVSLVVNDSSRQNIYDCRSAIFDLYTGEQLEFSDLFFEGDDIANKINPALKTYADKINSDGYIEMKREFTGITEGEFCFDGSAIIFPVKNPYFKNSEKIMINMSDTVLYIPRDMKGILQDNAEIYELSNWYFYNNKDIATDEYRLGNIVVYMLKKYNDIPAYRLDEINAKMFDMIYDDEVISSLGENVFITTNGDFAYDYIDEETGHYVRAFQVKTEIDDELKLIHIELSPMNEAEKGCSASWYLDYETLDVLNLDEIIKRVFGENTEVGVDNSSGKADYELTLQDFSALDVYTIEMSDETPIIYLNKDYVYWSIIKK